MRWQGLMEYGIRRVGLLVGTVLISPMFPGWALQVVNRPDLKQLKQAQVLQVVNDNTLLVQISTEPQMRLVSLIGVTAFPPADKNPEAVAGEAPLVRYYTGQFLQDLKQKTVYLELDPNLSASEEILPVYVWKGETFINQQVLFNGYAILPNLSTRAKYATVLSEAQDAASKQRRGYWNATPKPPGVALASR